MAVDVAKRGARAGQYTEEEVDRGLKATVMFSGNTRRAARFLADLGTPIPRSTLEVWMRKTYRTEYGEIRENALPIIRARLAEQNEELAVEYVQAEHRTVSLLLEKLQRAEQEEWECSAGSCSYISKQFENFRCPDHPEAAPLPHNYIDAKDLSAIAKNIGVPKGIATDKSLLLRGEPTEIHGQNDFATIERGLQRLGLIPKRVDAETTAEEST